MKSGDQMRKQTFISARRIVFVLTLAGMIVIPMATIRAQSSEENTNGEQATSVQRLPNGLIDFQERLRLLREQKFEGSCAAIVTAVVPPGVPAVPPFQVYLTNSRGGASIGSDRTRPFSGPQHGTWEHTGGNSFAATHVQDLFDGMGNFLGTLTVRQRITIIGQDEYVGVGNGETRDASGVIVSSRCSTLRGVRIKVEPLAVQCQSIVPPE